MRLPRVRFTMRWLLVAVAVFAISTWAAMKARKPLHYWEQAGNEARLEAKHRREERRLRAYFAPVGSKVADMEAGKADHHGHLKTLYQRLATHPWEDAPPDIPLPFPWDRDRDRAVLEAALADLMDPRNPENAIQFQTPDGLPCPEIVVAETTYHWSDDSNGDEDEAWGDLSRRNSNGPILLTGIGLGGSLTVRYDDPERLFQDSVDAGMAFSEYFHKLHPLACGYTWARLPGYSRDGRRAVVFFTGGFGGHPIRWTYELARTDGGWEVRERGRHFSE